MAIPTSPIYLAKLLEPDVKVEGRSRGEWATDLSSPDAATRAKAAAALGKMNTSGRKALPELVKVMQSDGDADVRAAACDAAGKMYPANDAESAKTEYTAAVLGAFTAGLTDQDMRVRHNAAIGILKLKEKARPAVPALIAAAKDSENDTNLNIYHATVRQVMLRALGEAAAGTNEAVPTFTAIMDEKLVKPKLPAAAQQQGGGGKVTKEDEEASRKFIQGSINRRIAAAGLGLAGEHGKAAAPKIQEMLRSSDRDDRDIAKEALGRMGIPADDK